MNASDDERFVDEFSRAEETLRVVYMARVARQTSGARDPSWSLEDFISDVRERVFKQWRMGLRPTSMVAYSKKVACSLISRRATSNEGRVRRAAQEWEERISNANDAWEHAASARGEARLEAIRKLRILSEASKKLPPKEQEMFLRYVEWVLSRGAEGQPAVLPCATETQRRTLNRALQKMDEILQEADRRAEEELKKLAEEESENVAEEESENVAREDD